MKLLHIDSSILGIRSVSRALSAQIVEREKTIHPDLTVAYRDLASDAALHLSGAHIAAWAGKALEGAALCCDLELGEEYLTELFEADIVVIGAPMYNFTVPSQLKAWIDRLAVAGKTFKYGPAGPVGLAGGKKLIVASSRGGFYGTSTPTASLDHQETYLRAVFQFMGITDITFIRAEGLAVGDQRGKSIE